MTCHQAFVLSKAAHSLSVIVGIIWCCFCVACISWFVSVMGPNAAASGIEFGKGGDWGKGKGKGFIRPSALATALSNSLHIPHLDRFQAMLKVFYMYSVVA
jgi:hypothetical protein